MTVFTPETPVRTRTPLVLVENELRPGVYLFELVVVDNEGKQSAPAFFEVRVVSGGRVVIRPPRRVPRPPQP